MTKTKCPRKPKKPIVYPPLPHGAVVLSLDVSSSVTGWAIGEAGKMLPGNIIDFGLIKPPSGWDSIRRADFMLVKLAAIVHRFQPDEVVMEWQSHKATGMRVQGLSTLGQAQGAIRSYLATTHRVVAISERAWTKIGGRNAKKEARSEVVKVSVPSYAEKASDPKFDPGLDIADAIGLLLYRLAM